MKKMCILINTEDEGLLGNYSSVWTTAQLKQNILTGKILKYLFHFDEVDIKTQHRAAIPRPVICLIVSKFLAKGKCQILEETNVGIPVTLTVIGNYISWFLRDRLSARKLLRAVEYDLAWIQNAQAKLAVNKLSSVLYIRSDLCLGVKAGGSVGHIAGVINAFNRLGLKTDFFSTQRIPTVDEAINCHLLKIDGRFQCLAELPSIHHNYTVLSELAHYHVPAFNFVYQRYRLNGFEGLYFARKKNIPFVLEYNGSEVWIANHWNTGKLKYNALSRKIEDVVLQQADLVVVISEVLKEELLQRGVSADRILCNPNGVDTVVYHPQVDCTEVIEKYGLIDNFVFGFIGTFGPWHGVDVLVDAYAELLLRDERLEKSTKLLLIGDGNLKEKIVAKIAQLGIQNNCILTGIVPQAQGPAYLAACDVLISPHVNNADGSRFFGSPTKIFEYMAMGKPIIASRLEQIKEVIQHEVTGLLVTPGDVSGLSQAMNALYRDSAVRKRLGVAARQLAESKHTWLAHTQKIMDKLNEIIRYAN